MSHFYSTLNGSRGEATRQGTKKSGLHAVAASWRGSVHVIVFHDPHTGEDKFTITQQSWHGRGIGEEIAAGVIGKSHCAQPDPRPEPAPPALPSRRRVSLGRANPGQV